MTLSFSKHPSYYPSIVVFCIVLAFLDVDRGTREEEGYGGS